MQQLIAGFHRWTSYLAKKYRSWRQASVSGSAELVSAHRGQRAMGVAVATGQFQWLVNGRKALKSISVNGA